MQECIIGHSEMEGPENLVIIPISNVAQITYYEEDGEKFAYVTTKTDTTVSCLLNPEIKPLSSGFGFSHHFKKWNWRHDEQD